MLWFALAILITGIAVYRIAARIFYNKTRDFFLQSFKEFETIPEDGVLPEEWGWEEWEKDFLQRHSSFRFWRNIFLRLFHDASMENELGKGNGTYIPRHYSAAAARIMLLAIQGMREFGTPKQRERLVRSFHAYCDEEDVLMAAPGFYGH